MPNADLHCCFIPEEEREAIEKAPSAAEAQVLGCQEDAEFEIIDQGDPNPYTCITHACIDHVGRLLGHAPNLSPETLNRWEVRSL